MKPYSRKQFIKLGTAASAALILNACGVNTGQKKKEGTINADSIAPSVPEGLQPITTTPDLIYNDDSRYDVLRRGFNKRIDRHPEVIALCTSTEDVVAAIKLAKEKGLSVAVKSGGHSMEGFSVSDGGMVINLSEMKAVEFLEGNRIKTGPGCTLSNLYDVILPKARILPAGSCATVGLGGLTLGGGYGIFSRKYGLTCDHLLSAVMVDGNGNVHHTDDNPELLWALRGGGTGNFGVVTEMVFATHPAPPTLQAHYFKSRKLTAQRATAILKTWMEVTAELPESCFSGYVLNGSTLNILVTNHAPDNEQLPELLKRMAAVTDEFRSSKVGKLQTMVKNYYGVGKPLFFRNSSAGLFSSFYEIAPFIEGVLEQIVSTRGMMYQVNTLGGRIRDAAFESGSSYPHRAFEFISELQAYWEQPAQEARLAAVTSEILKATEQGGVTKQYVNYCSLEFANWESAYYGDNYARLQAVKRKYDPDNIIRHPQSIKV